jgi:uncharacterized protein (DUF362 family)
MEKPMGTVGLVDSTYDNALENVRRVVKEAGGFPFQSGDAVAIKINMCDARTPDTGTITHPLFLDALLAHLRGSYESLRIFVVESDATVVLADRFIQWFGYMPVLNRWGAEWHNLSRNGVVEVPVKGYYLQQVPVPTLLTTARLLSLSKLKTNSLSTITCALKNQFGCLPMVQKSVYHDHLAEVIADVNCAMPPAFSIVDGILGQGTARGPAFGIPVRANVILAGRDPVSVDCAAARQMGFNPAGIKHIRLSEKAGVGAMEYTLAGDPMRKVDFQVSGLDDFQFRVARALRKFYQVKLRPRRKGIVQASVEKASSHPSVHPTASSGD